MNWIKIYRFYETSRMLSEDVMRKTFKDEPLFSGQNTPEEYDALFKKEDAWISSTTTDPVIYKEIKKLVPKRSTVMLLDMGCGVGRTLKYLENNGTDYRFTLFGIDFSKEAVKRADRRTKNTELSVQDMRKTSFKNKFFDIITSVGAHEHLREIDFSEPYRLLKKDGIFILELPVCAKTRGWKKRGVLGQNQFEWCLSRQDWIKELNRFNFFVSEIPETKRVYKDIFVCTKR